MSIDRNVISVIFMSGNSINSIEAVSEALQANSKLQAMLRIASSISRKNQITKKEKESLLSDFSQGFARYFVLLNDRKAGCNSPVARITRQEYSRSTTWPLPQRFKRESFNSSYLYNPIIGSNSKY